MFDWLEGGMKHARPVLTVPGLRNATHVWFNNFGDTFTTNGGNVRFCQAICQDVRVVDALSVVLFWPFSSSSLLLLRRVCLWLQLKPGSHVFVLEGLTAISGEGWRSTSTCTPYVSPPGSASWYAGRCLMKPLHACHYVNIRTNVAGLRWGCAQCGMGGMAYGAECSCDVTSGRTRRSQGPHGRALARDRPV